VAPRRSYDQEVAMFTVVQRVGIESRSPESTCHVVAAAEGLATWWTETVPGESRVGGVLQFRFPNTGADFEVLELTPQERVRWCWRVLNSRSKISQRCVEIVTSR
jgi:uncharacterized protein YndB with AHSA1/START domain